MSPEVSPSQQAPEFLSDLLKADCGSSPCSQFEDCGSGGDCGGDKADVSLPAKKPGFWHTMFMKGLQNTLNIAFDEVYKEPKKILMIGGCRQRDFARHVALMLPAADITLIDPVAEEAEKAKAEVCCRFKFVTGSIESLPFDNGQFDLVIAHNLSEYVENWNTAHSEIQRVITLDQGNLMVSALNQLPFNALAWVPGFKPGLKATGVSVDTRQVNAAQMKQAFKAAPGGALSLEISPLPWEWLVFRFNSR